MAVECVWAVYVECVWSVYVAVDVTVEDTLDGTVDCKGDIEDVVDPDSSPVLCWDFVGVSFGISVGFGQKEL